MESLLAQAGATGNRHSPPRSDGGGLSYLAAYNERLKIHINNQQKMLMLNALML